MHGELNTDVFLVPMEKIEELEPVDIQSLIFVDLPFWDFNPTVIFPKFIFNPPDGLKIFWEINEYYDSKDKCITWIETKNVFSRPKIVYDRLSAEKTIEELSNVVSKHDNVIVILSGNLIPFIMDHYSCKIRNKNEQNNADIYEKIPIEIIRSKSPIAR